MTEQKKSYRGKEKMVTSRLTFHSLTLPKPSAKKRKKEKKEKKENKEKSTN